MVTGTHQAVAAGRELDLEGRPKFYTLTLGRETIPLEPGKPWIRADTFKWSMRGLVEEPQSYHVLSDGTVDINGEHIPLDHPEGERRLEIEINKHHAAPVPTPQAKPSAAGTNSRKAAAAVPDQVRFRVHVDHLSHLCIEASRGEERSETGLRGLPGLVKNGLLLPLPEYRVDPLQRSIEIEGVQYEASDSGAAALEQLLNQRFAPKARPPGDRQISIRENPASSTGFDIRFVTSLSGMRVEVKGHMNQDRLNILQDASKCDLLRPGILIRLIPPLLLVRRKRPDGGEERIPELPDIQYRRATAAGLQELFNHPLLRKGELPQTSAPPIPPVAVEPPEAHAPPPTMPSPADRPAARLPLAEAPSRAPDPNREPRAVPPAQPTASAVELQASETSKTQEQSELEKVGLAREHELEALFCETDPLRIHDSIFRHLHRALQVELQDVRLSLPRVFENRRFEVLSFSHPSISELGDIRCEEFYGWYLSHVEPRDLLLVYACAGCHMEWGSRRCVLQSSLRAEAEEFSGSGVRGLLQDSQGKFVFIVSQPFKSWVRSREADCRRALLRFLTVPDLASSSDSFTYIWPQA